MHNADNCHTFTLTPGRPYVLWASSTLVSRRDEQVFDRSGGSRTLLRVILRGHILLPLGPNTLSMAHYKIFYIINF